MSTQPGRTVETARHLHYVLRMGGPQPPTPVLDSAESWNWAVRISVVGLFVLALAGIAYSMATVVVPVLLAWVVAMVLLPVVDGLERRGLSRALTSIVLVILLPQRCDAKLLQVLFPQARKDRLVYVILAEDRLSVGIFLSSKDLSCLPGISGATCSLGNFPGCLTAQRPRRKDQRALVFLGAE